MTTAMPLLILAPFLAFAYYPVLLDLAANVMANDLYRHAPLVAGISAYTAWQTATAKSSEKAAEDAITSSGPGIMIAGLFLNLAGQVLGVFYLSQLSLVLTIYGVVVFVGGYKTARKYIFPIFFLVFAYPLPGKLYYELAFPLKLIVSKVSAVILDVVGFDVVRKGNILHVSGSIIGVNDACSGLNSLMAIMSLSLFYGWYILKNNLFRTLTFIFMIPAIVGANIIRVALTGILAVKFGSEAAEGTLHSALGFAVFAISVGVLMLMVKFFSHVESKKGA